jgi:uncharacterized protein DUF2802
MQWVSDLSIYGLRTVMLLVAFAGFGWAMLSARRQAAEAHAQLGARLEAALGEIRRLSGQMIALGGSVESLGTQITQAAREQAQAQVKAQAQAVPRAAASNNGMNTRGYETAIRMARSGSSVEEIVANCGTTRAEAKLLRRLHECGGARKAESQGVLS